ncbi:hypothetical protein OVA24_15595 [Luteolibacter sp. SL250]|uniref:hypothetical protein n=1 Tax=Luteolibacter sp. SL250 TaxID=2995170 RepID=UPI0022722C07|nr:hypothetical protein [Luteolibacter sp. SL250]WAC18656.1 hypothetical protein OVA24_15595 [Luteolibacter sp. SL250]
MDTPSKDSNRQWWQGQAKRTARRINLAWWLETLATPLIVGGLAGAAGLLVIRNREIELPPAMLAGVIGGAVLLIGLICWVVAARRFEKPERSLVRIEATMEMKNALSAATAGVAPWPAPVPEVDPGVRWHWPRLVVPPLAALALLAAGLFIPVSSAKTPTTPPEQPQAWKQLDSSLEHLSKEELVDEKYLEETRKKLEELKAQKEEQWFSHSSLEATDSLKKEHRSEMDRVEQELERAEKALESLEKNGGANQAEKERQLNEFQQAMQGLQNGAMKPNPELLEQLKQMDPNKLGQLSKEQMQQLRENLKKNANGMKKGQGDGQGDDWSDELLADENGDGEGKGPGDKPGNGRGKGGVNRGPGHDPGVLGNEKDGLETGDLTAVESRDLSNALPGDLLQLQDGEHDVDKSGSRITQGGNTDATGAGGDRVWKDSLDPGEQKTLKKFFE